MAFGTGFDNDDNVMSEINMTPLVDVMLVLLIIFMLTVPVLTHSVKVELPQAANTPNKIEPETVTLSVMQNGQIHWNESPVDKHQLEERLQTAALQTPQPDIQIRGDRKAPYQHVIDVLAVVQASGLEKLGFITQPND